MKIYRISWLPIITFMLAGTIILLLPFGDINRFLSDIFVFISLLFLSFVFLGYSFYLLSNRNKGNGFYWDDKGIVIDLKGNRIYWNEIEEIKFYKSSITHMRSTVIYPHYTYHEKIRIRRKKFMPTTAHSIDWILIERPKEYHKNLLKSWEEKRY